MSYKEIKNLNRSIANKKTESGIKTSQPRKVTPVPDVFIGELYKTFKEELTPIFFILFNKIEKQKTLPKLFC